MTFGIGEAPAGQDVAALVKSLDAVHRNPGALAAVKEATTSCIQWGNVLKELLEEGTIQLLFVRQHGVTCRPTVFDRIAGDLRNEKAVIMFVKLPGSTNHMFTIEPRRGGKARILHAWQNMHELRAERVMPIEEMVGSLKRLQQLDWINDIAELEQVRRHLWGPDHAKTVNITTSSRRKVSFDTIISGTPDGELTTPRRSARLRSLSDVSDWHSAVSEVSDDWHSAMSRGGPEGGEVHGRQRVSVKWAAGAGTGLGFVLGAGGAILHARSKGEDINYEEVGLEGLKAGLAGGIAEGGAAAVAKYAVPTFTRIGASVVRANAVAGVAMFGVFAIWDVAEWKMNKVTSVELRKRLAQGAGTAGGGLLGGAGAGVAGGMIFGPIGAVVGGIIGGIAGGIGGSFAGRAIDEAIWDESEDAVMDSYEFFGWRHVTRGHRPIKTPKEIGKAYDKKLKARPSKVKVKDWNKTCVAYLMVLLQAMFPEFKEMMKSANDLLKNKSFAQSVIGTSMLEAVPEE